MFQKEKTRFLLQKSSLCLLECTTFSSFGMFTNCVRSNCDHLYHAIFLDLTFEKSKEPNKILQSDVKRPTFEKKAQSNVYFVGASCKQIYVSWKFFSENFDLGHFVLDTLLNSLCRSTCHAEPIKKKDFDFQHLISHESHWYSLYVRWRAQFSSLDRSCR